MKPEQEKVDAALVEKGSSPISSREEQFSIEYDEEQFEADTRTAIELSCERPRSVKEDAAFESLTQSCSPIASRGERFSSEFEREKQFEADTRTALELSCSRSEEEFEEDTRLAMELSCQDIRSKEEATPKQPHRGVREVMGDESAAEEDRVDVHLRVLQRFLKQPGAGNNLFYPEVEHLLAAQTREERRKFWEGAKEKLGWSEEKLYEMMKTHDGVRRLSDLLMCHMRDAVAEVNTRVQDVTRLLAGVVVFSNPGGPRWVEDSQAQWEKLKGKSVEELTAILGWDEKALQQWKDQWSKENVHTLLATRIIEKRYEVRRSYFLNQPPPSWLISCLVARTRAKGRAGMEVRLAGGEGRA